MMLRSATGTRRVRSARGFTLLVLLVVVAIAGLLVSLVALSLGGIGGPRPEAELRDLADRIALAHEGSTLSGRTLGLRQTADGIEFLAFAIDPATRRAVWGSVGDERQLAPARFPAPYRLSIEVDGTAATVGGAAPSIILLPDGDMTPFRITLGADGVRSARLVGDEDGTLHLGSSE